VAQPKGLAGTWRKFWMSRWMNRSNSAAKSITSRAARW